MKNSSNEAIKEELESVFGERKYEMKTDVKSMLELRKIKIEINYVETNALDYIEYLENLINNKGK